MTAPMRKFRYEFPPMEAHFFAAPSAEAAVLFLRRTYPHNTRDILSTLREIPRWPEFWKTVDHQGMLLPPGES